MSHFYGRFSHSTERAVPFSLVLSGLLLRCQTLTSPRRRRRDVHPECFPPAPKCCTCVTTARGERGLLSDGERAVSHFYQSNLAAWAAITDYVAGSDAWWTQPLLKLVWTLIHPSGLGDQACTTSGRCSHAARHTVKQLYSAQSWWDDKEKKKTSISWITTESEAVQLYERPGWSAVLHSLGYYTHFWDQPFHFTRYSQRPCKKKTKNRSVKDSGYQRIACRRYINKWLRNRCGNTACG